MQSKTIPPFFQRTGTSTTLRPIIDINSIGEKVTDLIDMTTTSPFLIVNKSPKNTAAAAAAIPKVIDGDALLSNFDVNNLTDDERREMLTNILGVIQSRTATTTTNNVIKSSIPKSTKTAAKRSSNDKRKNNNNSIKSSTRLLPVTKANNVRIISSLDELNKDASIINNGGDKSNNQPIYVVLLPQNKKKK